MKTLLFTLLLATSAVAQPVVGPEVASAPLPSLGDFAVAPQRDGFVIAWEQGGRIYAGQLDSSLHLTAAPLELPVTDSRAVASSPAIASDGTTVLVAWHELMISETNAVALLTPDAQLLLRGPQQLNVSPKPPLATTSNGRYVVYSDELRYGFNDALERVSFDSIPRAMSAAISTTGDVATASEDDGVFALYSIAAPINADAAIAGNGSDIVVAWVDGHGVIVHADRQPEPFAFSDRIVEDLHLIAAGSNTFVVFYRASGSLAGRVIHFQPSRQRAVR
ncbi:MAG TPA: hypothetical protein VH087_04075 [Thermoanaerobaculia bacterium]|nr:hypothetical protein [Thermoanaerobaculia bacterium]